MTRTKRPADYNVKNIWEDCGKCGGSGSVDWGIDVAGSVTLVKQGKVVGHRTVEKVCFTCHGARGKRVSQGQLDRREYNRKLRERKAAEKAAAKAAEVAAKEAAKLSEFEEWKTDNADVVTFLEGLTFVGEPGTFLFDMVDTYRYNRALSERQTEAVRRIAVQRAEERKNSSPVIEGRIVITGTVIRVKEQFNYYGSVIKMLVKDDRGFRVWGTMPKAIMGEQCEGKNVTFTAKVTAKEGDETFGFYSRPTKASLVEA
jgi:hypothetical protein